MAIARKADGSPPIKQSEKQLAEEQETCVIAENRQRKQRVNE